MTTYRDDEATRRHEALRSLLVQHDDVLKQVISQLEELERQLALIEERLRRVGTWCAAAVVLLTCVLVFR